MCVCVSCSRMVLHISCERVLMFSKIRRGTDDFMICVFTSFSSFWEARFSWSWYFDLLGPLMWIICQFRMAIGIVSGLWSVE